MSKKQSVNYLSVSFKREEVTLLSAAIMKERNRLLELLAHARGFDEKVIKSMIEGYGRILNNLENATWEIEL